MPMSPMNATIKNLVRHIGRPSCHHPTPHLLEVLAQTSPPPTKLRSSYQRLSVCFVPIGPGCQTSRGSRMNYLEHVPAGLDSPCGVDEGVYRHLIRLMGAEN